MVRRTATGVEQIGDLADGQRRKPEGLNPLPQEGRVTGVKVDDAAILQLMRQGRRFESVAMR